MGEEVQHLLPAVHGLLLAVAGPVDGEEAVPGAVVAVKLVRLAVLLQLGLDLIDLLGVRVAVLVAEDPQQGAGHLRVRSMGARGWRSVRSSGRATTPPPQQSTAAFRPGTEQAAR